MKFTKVLSAILFASIILVTLGDIHINKNKIECNSDTADCGNGSCLAGYFNKTIGYCHCDSKYVNVNIGTNVVPCSYKRKGKLETFLISFFVGYLGADWFYLARDDVGYNVAGAFKLITLGGCGIWWLVDWIRILADDFNDGNGVELSPW
jgi:hypothetical protein